MSESSVAVDAEWRPAYGFDGIAVVSREGVVRTLDRIVVQANGRKYPVKGRICEPRWDRAGGVISLANKPVFAHRLIASTWIRPVQSDERVVHVDGDTKNCHVDNLKIVHVSAAMHDYVSRKRQRNNRRKKLQLRGEVWRLIPGTIHYDLSNFGRARSRAGRPSVIMQVRESSRGVAVIWVVRDGRRTSLSLPRMMRAIWPEVSHEWADGRTLEAKASKRKSGNVSGIETAKKTARKSGQEQPENAVETRQKYNVFEDKTG